jgi:YbbR domain-containing protein
MEGEAMSGYILNNLRLKLLAIFFSIALWFFVGGQRDAQVGFLMEVDLAGAPQDMVMVGERPGQVEVRLSGPQGFINNLSPSQVQIMLDVGSAKEGKNTYRIESHDIIVPRGIEVVNVSPNSFDVRFERLIAVMLPVRVNFAGTPAMGYQAINLKAEPSDVKVFGNKTAVANIKRIYTRLVDIEGFDSTRNLQVPLAFPEGVRAGSLKNVYVTVTIEKKERPRPGL